MSLYLIKHRILIRIRFIDTKSLHVMYYQQFDRSMAYELLMSFENVLKDSKNGQRFGVTLRHDQVKMVKVQTRIYKT